MRAFILALLAACVCASPQYLKLRNTGVEDANRHVIKAAYIRSPRSANQEETAQQTANVAVEAVTKKATDEIDLSAMCKCLLGEIDATNSAYCDSIKDSLRWITLSKFAYDNTKVMCVDIVRSPKSANQDGAAQQTANVEAVTKKATDEIDLSAMCKCLLGEIDATNSAYCDSIKDSLRWITLSKFAYDNSKVMCVDILRSPKSANQEGAAQQTANVEAVTKKATDDFDLSAACKCLLSEIDATNSAYCDSIKDSLRWIMLNKFAYENVKLRCVDIVRKPGQGQDTTKISSSETPQSVTPVPVLENKE